MSTIESFDGIYCGDWGARSAPVIAIGASLYSARYMGLIEGDGFSTYRMPMCNVGPVRSVAVEVEITGRKVVYQDLTAWQRARITFPGDGEADTAARGWVRVK